MSASDRVSVTDAGILMMASDEIKHTAAELKAAHTFSVRGNDWGNAPEDQSAKAHHERMLWLVDRLDYIAGIKR